MKAVFSRLAIAALICVVQSRSRGYGQRPMQLAGRRQHQPEDLSGREALAIAMITLKQVQELFEKYQWADLFAYPDLSITLPGHEQLHSDDYLTSGGARGHPWIVLQIPPLKPKGKPTRGFDQYYPNYHYPEPRPKPQYSAASPPVPRPVPPPRTASQRAGW